MTIFIDTFIEISPNLAIDVSFITQLSLRRDITIMRIDRNYTNEVAGHQLVVYFLKYLAGRLDQVTFLLYVLIKIYVLKCYMIRFFAANKADSHGRQIEEMSNQWFGATLTSTGRNGPIVVSDYSNFLSRRTPDVNIKCESSYMDSFWTKDWFELYKSAYVRNFVYS